MGVTTVDICSWSAVVCTSLSFCPFLIQDRFCTFLASMVSHLAIIWKNQLSDPNISFKINTVDIMNVTLSVWSCRCVLHCICVCTWQCTFNFKLTVTVFLWADGYLHMQRSFSFSFRCQLLGWICLFNNNIFHFPSELAANFLSAILRWAGSTQQGLKSLFAENIWLLSLNIGADESSGKYSKQLRYCKTKTFSWKKLKCITEGNWNQVITVIYGIYHYLSEHITCYLSNVFKCYMDYWLSKGNIRENNLKSVTSKNKKTTS